MYLFHKKSLLYPGALRKPPAGRIRASSGTRGGFDRGSTLIYYFRKVRSRTHFPAAAPAGACSRWPWLSDGCSAVLFPFTAIFTWLYFTIVCAGLSSVPEKHGATIKRMPRKSPVVFDSARTLRFETEMGRGYLPFPEKETGGILRKSYPIDNQATKRL